MTAPSYKDKRKFSRRSKTMRFRFDADGGIHRAVCSNVSAGGAFLKASTVPDKGSPVLLREVFRGDRDIGLRVKGEVVWTIPRATLENPETGYAMQFSEAWTAGDTAPLKDFANTLSPGQDHLFERAQREGQEVTLYRFPKLKPTELNQSTHGPSTYDALPEVDLASELDRLDRQQRRRASPSGEPPPPGEEPPPAEAKTLSYYTRARPKKATRATGDATHEVSVQGEVDLRPPEGALPALEIDGPQPEEDLELHASPRRRRFGGLLGLFGFGKEDGGEAASLPLEESGFDQPAPSLSPTFDYGRGGDDGARSAQDPALVHVSWKDNEAEGIVEKVSAKVMAISTRGPSPLHYERVIIVPAFPTLTASRLTMHGTVTRIKDTRGDGSQTLLIRFSQVEERGAAGALQEYIDRLGT